MTGLLNPWFGFALLFFAFAVLLYDILRLVHIRPVIQLTAGLLILLLTLYGLWTPMSQHVAQKTENPLSPKDVLEATKRGATEALKDFFQKPKTEQEQSKAEPTTPKREPPPALSLPKQPNSTIARPSQAYPIPDSEPQFSVNGANELMSLIRETGNAWPPLVTKFARIKVANMGKKKIENVKVVLTKLNDRDWRFQLPVASRFTLFQFPNPTPVLDSVNLNPGDDQYFDALVECSGVICPKGELAIPIVENGQVGFTNLGVVQPIKELTVRVSGDAVTPLTKTFVVSIQPKGQLFLEAKPKE